MMRIRSLSALSLIGVLAYCAEPTSNANGAPGFARLALQTKAPPSLAMFAPALIVEQVEVLIFRQTGREESELVTSRTFPFSETTNSLRLAFDVAVNGTEELVVDINYQTGTGLNLWNAGSNVTVETGRTATPPELQPFYTGPGSEITFMSMNGDDTTVTAGSDVQLDVSAIDANQAAVTQFYLTWSTDDPRVTVSPRGVVHTRAGVTQELRVFARAPNGIETSTFMIVQGPDLMALSPDSVELRPGQEQLFRVTVGSGFDISTTWSVGGVDGGNATLGTVSSDGFYFAPAQALPNEETQVCIRDSNAPTTKGCAKVRIPATPSAGADIIVINDLNIFDSLMMVSQGNQRFVRNLFNNTGVGPRTGGHIVWSDRGRDSGCALPNDIFAECSDSAKKQFFTEVRQAGYTVASFDGTPADLLSIPPEVRAIIFWMPFLSFSGSEVNALKAFAGQGGRIVFIGENIDYYLQAGIDVENALLASLGSEMVNRGDLIDCVDESFLPLYYTTPSKSMRRHSVTEGVTSLRYICGSEVQLGAGDFPIFYDTSNTFALGGVAKISLIPLTLTDAVNSGRRIPAPDFDRPRGNSRGAIR